jgi:hypothetical protein
MKRGLSPVVTPVNMVKTDHFLAWDGEESV